MSAKRTRNTYVQSMITVAMCTGIIVISSWLTIPFTVNFTLQTLAIFIISALFGIKKSIVSLTVYVIIGACGLPVFSGLGAGPSVLFGPTGGYLLGFFFIPITIHLFGNRSRIALAFSMLAGLILCYTFGTLWYIALYGISASEGVIGILAVCVFPFIIPDAIKVFIATIIVSRLSALIIN